MGNIFENPGEFLHDIQETLDILKNKGMAEAEPFVAKLKEKYAKGAVATKGGECTDCGSCSACNVCGVSSIETLQASNTLSLFHGN